MYLSEKFSKQIKQKIKFKKKSFKHKTKMSTIEEFIKSKGEIDLGNLSKLRLIGEGSMGSTYHLKNENYSLAIKCITDNKFLKDLFELEE